MSFAEIRGFEGGYAAPFAFAVLGGAFVTALGTLGALILDGAPHFDLLAVTQISLFAFVIALAVVGVAATIIGLPLTLLLAGRRLERPWTYPLAGLVVGAALVIFTPVLTGQLRGGSIFEFFQFAWVGALPGCVCGAIWWWSYRRYVQESGASDA